MFNFYSRPISKFFILMIKINKKLFLFSVLIFLLTAPVVILAQPPGPFAGTPVTLVANIIGLVGSILWSISIAFVVVMFTLAGFKFLTAQGEPQKISEARTAVIWGTVGVAVIVLAWSMVSLLRAQFGV